MHDRHGQENVTHHRSSEEIFELAHKAEQQARGVQKPSIVTKMCQPSKLELFSRGRHSQKFDADLATGIDNALSWHIPSSVEYESVIAFADV